MPSKIETANLGDLKRLLTKDCLRRSFVQALSKFCSGLAQMQPIELLKVLVIRYGAVVSCLHLLEDRGRAKHMSNCRHASFCSRVGTIPVCDWQPRLAKWPVVSKRILHDFASPIRWCWHDCASRMLRQGLHMLWGGGVTRSFCSFVSGNHDNLATLWVGQPRATASGTCLPTLSVDA